LYRGSIRTVGHRLGPAHPQQEVALGLGHGDEVAHQPGHRLAPPSQQVVAEIHRVGEDEFDDTDPVRAVDHRHPQSAVAGCGLRPYQAENLPGQRILDRNGFRRRDAGQGDHAQRPLLLVGEKDPGPTMKPAQRSVHSGRELIRLEQV
jgi:hypothetical protein